MLRAFLFCTVFRRALAFAFAGHSREWVVSPFRSSVMKRGVRHTARKLYSFECQRVAPYALALSVYLSIGLIVALHDPFKCRQSSIPYEIRERED